MFFVSKLRRGFKVFGGAKAVDDEVLQPLLPIYPNIWHEWGEVNETAAGDIGGAPLSGPRFKVGKHSAAQKERKKKAKRVFSVIGEKIGNAVVPGLLDAHQKARTNPQLIYPPFMLSPGVFMFFL